MFTFLFLRFITFSHHSCATLLIRMANDCRLNQSGLPEHHTAKRSTKKTFLHHLGIYRTLVNKWDKLPINQCEIHQQYLSCTVYY